jgi:UDP-glucuronate 4-epimerase
MAIHKFVLAIANGRPIPVFGDGSSRRDYTFIDDIVRGVVAACEFTQAGHWGLYNLGNTATISLTDLIAMIEQVIGKPALIERHPDQPGDVPITFADVTNAARDLGYRPTTAIEEGLPRFWHWYKTAQSP